MNEREYLELELVITPFEVEDVVTGSLDDLPKDQGTDTDMGEWFI